MECLVGKSVMTAVKWRNVVDPQVAAVAKVWWSRSKGDQSERQRHPIHLRQRSEESTERPVSRRGHGVGSVTKEEDFRLHMLDVMRS